MTDIVLTAYMLFCLSFVYVRLGVIAPVTFLAATNLVSCTVLLWVSAQALSKFDFMTAGIYFSAMPMASIGTVTTQTLAYFALISTLCMGVCVDVRPFAFRRILQDYSLKGSLLRMSGFLRNRDNTLIVNSVGALLMVSTLVHFIDLDKSLLWHNTNYLTIKNPELMGMSNEFTSIYHSLFRLVGLLSGVLGVILFRIRKPGLAILFFVLWSYAVGLLFLGNSRWLLLYFLSVGVTTVIFGKGAKSYVIMAVMIVLGIGSYIQVIYGRSGDTFGVSVLMSQFFTFTLADVPFALRGFLINSFEGALNVANSILIEPSFPERYQIGSISPLFSAIDGFDEIRDTDKVKFAPHVPMGAFGEVFHFDWYLQVLYFLILWGAMRATVTWEFQLPITKYLPLAIFYIYVFYLLPTYSARTTARFLFIAFAVYTIGPSLRSLLFQASRPK